MKSPAGLPAAIIDKLNATINAGLRSGELGAALANIGLEAKSQMPQELQQIILTETRLWDAVVAETGIKVD